MTLARPVDPNTASQCIPKTRAAIERFAAKNILRFVGGHSAANRM